MLKAILFTACAALALTAAAFARPTPRHADMVALYTVFYNFVRIHKSLKVTPAMTAGVTDRLWSMEDVIARMDTAAPVAAKRGPYKKRAA